MTWQLPLRHEETRIMTHRRIRTSFGRTTLLTAALLMLSTAAAGDDAGTAAAAPAGSDLAKEQRWRDQIVDSLMDGDAVDLTAGDLTFLGLYTEADEPTGRGAIIIHGIGVHPNWPQVVYPLRTRLPGDGWTTLSIQMPILPNEAEEAEYAPLMNQVAPRIEAARAFLADEGIERIAIVAHSLGATMANRYLSAHPDGAAAYVAIGNSGGGGQPGRTNTEMIAEIKAPMLDLYGEQDLPGVVGSAADRAGAGAANAGYHQAVVPAADHFFDGQEDALVEIVLGWLDETVPAQ
jgi:pimeloyl-ACP methyl ester carboxylesterase